MVVFRLAVLHHEEHLGHQDQMRKILWPSFLLSMSFTVIVPFLKVAQLFRMLVDAVVEHGDAIGIDQTAIFRAPAGPIPGVTVLQ